MTRRVIPTQNNIRMIAITISTYERPDGKTLSYLNRTLTSIDNQTYKDYTVYLVGDAFQDVKALKREAKKHRNVKCYNLNRSPEQERYEHGTVARWCAGGVTAANTGIQKALEDGIDYICHQSHDDLWEPDHLETINNVIEKHNPFFVCTLSTYNNVACPPMVTDNEVIPFYPLYEGIIACSTCVKYSETNIRVIDRLHEEGILSPCDAYLWLQLKSEMEQKNRKGYLVRRVTCHHDEEGYSNAK